MAKQDHFSGLIYLQTHFLSYSYWFHVAHPCYVLCLSATLHALVDSQMSVNQHNNAICFTRTYLKMLATHEMFIQFSERKYSVCLSWKWLLLLCIISIIVLRGKSRLKSFAVTTTWSLFSPAISPINYYNLFSLFHSLSFTPHPLRSRFHTWVKFGLLGNAMAFYCTALKSSRCSLFQDSNKHHY